MMNLPIPTSADFVQMRVVPSRAKLPAYASADLSVSHEPCDKTFDAIITGQVKFSVEHRLSGAFEGDRNARQNVLSQMARDVHHFVYGPVIAELDEVLRAARADGMGPTDPVYTHISRIRDELEGGRH